TTNGGTNWSQLTSGTTAKLLEVTFKSTSLAIAVGDSGKILKSTNLGASWVKKNTSNKGYNAGVAFYSSTNGYVAGWDTCPSGQFTGSHFKFRYTNNGGDTWVADTSSNCSIFGLLIASKNMSVSMPGSSTTFIVKSLGKVYKQTSFNGNWWDQTSTTDMDLRGVHFANTTVGYAVGPYGVVIKTVDGGANWSEVTPAFSRERIFGVDFYDAKYGFVVGEMGNMTYRTNNGGSTWIKTTIPSSVILNDVDFLTSTSAVAVGAGGTIFRYSGGWSAKTSGITKNLHGVSFPNQNNGCAVGDSGFIVVSNNGGNTWSLSYSGTSQNLYGVDFTDTLYGWAVGASGTIIKTTDGGSNWFYQTSGTAQSLQSVDFTDRNNGTAVGANGTILHTINGGINWLPQTSGTTNTLYGVSFTNKQFGIITASNGLILFTANSGSIWFKDTCETSNTLYDISYVNNCGTVVGSEGTVLRTDTGKFVFNPPIPPAGFDFGNVATTTSRADTQQIMNVGLSSLTISSIVSDNTEFSISPLNTAMSSVPDTGGSWILFPDSVFTLRIVFTPSVVGIRIGHIIFTHNSPGSPDTLTVTGNGSETDLELTYKFGYPPTNYPTSLCFPAHHKDVVAMVFIAPATGTLDSFHFQTCNVGALDNTVYLRIHKSRYGLNSGPAYDGYEQCTAWGTYPNTNDQDKQIAAFSEDATGPWISTTGSSPASQSPALQELWGAGGYPLIVEPNSIEHVDLDDLPTDLSIQKGDSLFVSIRIKSTPEGTHNGEIPTDPPTEFAAYKYPNELCETPYTPVYKFYEHEEISSECPQVDNTRGWRTVCNGVDLGGFVFNWWFSMTPSSDPPPEIDSYTQIPPLVMPNPVEVIVTTANDDITSARIDPCSCYTVPPSTVMNNIGGDTWEAQLPGYPPGTEVCYQVTLTDSSGQTTTSAPVQYTVVDLELDEIQTTLDTISNRLSGFTGTTIASSSFFLPSGNYDGANDPLDNGTAGPFNLGGKFIFFNDTVQYAWIGVDGAVSLSKLSTDTNHINRYGLFVSDPKQFESLNPTGFLIAPFYANFLYNDSSIISYGIDTTLGEHKFIIQWWMYEDWWSMNKLKQTFTSVKFRAILNLSRGTVEIQYDEIPVDLTRFISYIAIETPGTNSLSVFKYNGSPQDMLFDTILTFRFTPAVRVSVCDKWDMLSLPVLPFDGDYRPTSIYPSAVSDAFVYCDAVQYCARNQLTMGEGFWLKFNGASSLRIVGEKIAYLEVPVVKSWNLIGSISYSLPTYRISHDPWWAELGPFWEWNCNGYIQVNQLKPGKGYWVRSDTNAILYLDILNWGKTPQQQEVTLEQLDEFTLQDASGGSQSLYIGKETGINVPLRYFELPPMMQEMFDARFASGRMVEVYSETMHKDEQSRFVIELSNVSFPVTVKPLFNSDPEVQYVVSDDENGKYIGEQVIHSKEEITISHSSVKRIVIKVSNGSVALPKEFSLRQNYPNPFNPKTLLKYELPMDAHVTLKLFNILGQEVATLVNGIQEAGYHTKVWSAESMPSGMYFYRLEATGVSDPTQRFTDVKKAILIK
ncbi:MAG: T9SS type A sorting domain-containing protein, partial [Ignavibacteriae bacterium]|nr:T9SS type A sorting domain-containing protein [Ignavibacteriota bacterium]